ncbi:MAG: hypothetical protein ACF8XB_02600 [Planctomycetota bacterium JB042]
MTPSVRLILALSTVACVAAAALTVRAAGSGTIGFAFADGFQDDPVGAQPWGLVTPGGTPIQTDVGEVFTAWPVDPRAIVEVVAIPGPSGPNHVLRVSDANIHDGTAHSEVTIRPIGTQGTVSVRFEMTLLNIVGDQVRVGIIDNRTTPGTGRLAALTIESDGRLLVGGMPTSLVLGTGATYRFAMTFDLGGQDDRYSVAVQEVGGTDSMTLTEVPVGFDAATISDFTFSLTDGGNGAFDLDNIRILNIF